MFRCGNRRSHKWTILQLSQRLAAIIAGQDAPVFDTALLNEKALKTSSATRDRLVMRLQKEEYIDGIYIEDSIDNLPPTILWKASKPELTIKVMEFVKTNDTLHNTFKELKDAGISIASQTISNIITNFH